MQTSIETLGLEIKTLCDSVFFFQLMVNGRKDWDFTSFSTVFQSYLDDGRAFTIEKISASGGARTLNP